MRTILCYGDSLTWGYNAEGPGRHALADRWPSVLGAGLGSDVQVIAEGLNGRTTAFDDHMTDCERNGTRTLPMILDTHTPLDLVIIMLGANDMKPFISGHSYGSKQGIDRLVQIVLNRPYTFDWPKPKVLIVSPPPLCDTPDPDFKAMFEGGPSESRKLAALYAQSARELGVGFFDAGSVAKTTPLDGVHMDAENTRALGQALVPVVKGLLGL